MPNTLPTLTPAQAQSFADDYAARIPSEAVAKRFDDVAGLTYATADDVFVWFKRARSAKRAAAIDAEAVSGWFQADGYNDPDADEDGDFVSTPCYSEGDDIDDIHHDLHHAARAGLLIIDPAFFA